LIEKGEFGIRRKRGTEEYIKQAKIKGMLFGAKKKSVQQVRSRIIEGRF
jgi:hypothetical protein